MKLGGKIITAALIAVVFSLIISLVNQLVVLRKQGSDMIFDSMRGMVVSGEAIRAQLSDMHRQSVFRSKELMDEAKTGDIRQSRVYKTIPIVGAWLAIGKAAESEGYVFRVIKNQARNEKNLPAPDEAWILKELEGGSKEEIRFVDNDHKEILYARPIRLTADCLTCHGDPKTSPTGDGKDFLGFQMENWKEGEVHGAFVLKSNFAHLNAQIAKGFKAALWVVVPSMIGFAIILALALHYGTARIILRPLHRAMNAIKADSEKEVAIAAEISSASMRLAESATEQAASLEETSSALVEISSMTKRNAEHAEASQVLAADTRKAADSGAQAMEEMNRAMQEIKAASDNIAAIIKTIDEIAFQTNILALNAAVEAARAGDAGMGFAVVAEEVRALAQRSASAAKETAAKIEDSIKKSQYGVVVSGKVSQSLSEILGRAKKLDELVREITVGSKEQSEGIHQVTEAITQLDQLTQQNAATAEESASASTELKASADQLDRTIGTVIQVIGSGSDAIDHKEGIQQAISKAIGAHGMWKNRLKTAIATRKSDVPVAKVCQDNQCEFGKWLYALDGRKRTSRWQCVKAHHADFHKEAAAVLQLALEGRKDEATARLSESSKFAVISSQLTKEMMDWSNESS